MFEFRFSFGAEHAGRKSEVSQALLMAPRLQFRLVAEGALAAESPFPKHPPGHQWMQAKVETEDRVLVVLEGESGFTNEIGDST